MMQTSLAAAAAAKHPDVLPSIASFPVRQQQQQQQELLQQQQQQQLQQQQQQQPQQEGAVAAFPATRQGFNDLLGLESELSKYN